MTDPRNLDDVAAKLAARLNAAGVNADIGLGGSVIIYASDEQAAAFLAAIDAGTAEANAERITLIAAVLREHISNAQLELTRFQQALAHVDSTYRLRTGPPAMPGTATLRDAVLNALGEPHLGPRGLSVGQLARRLRRDGWDPELITHEALKTELGILTGTGRISPIPAQPGQEFRWVLAR